MGATNTAGNADPSGAPDFNHD